MTALAAALSLALAGPVAVPPDDVLAAMRQLHQGAASQRVAEGGSWYSLALAQDSALVWPAGATVVLELKGGGTLAALEAFAMSPPPEQRIVRLGGPAVTLDPGALWRRRFRNLGVRTVIFARFARAFPCDSVMDARVQSPGGAAAPAPATKGVP